MLVADICDRTEMWTDEGKMVSDFLPINASGFRINKSLCDKERVIYNLPKAIFSQKRAYDIVTESWGQYLTDFVGF